MKTKKWVKILNWSLVLTVLVMVNSCKEDDYIYIIEEDSNPPSASFSYSIDGLTVNFKNKSEDATTFSWVFGDGSTGSEASNFDHVYAAKGTYTVTLTATDGNGVTSTYSEVIKAGYPIASFTYFVDKETVTFTNTSFNATTYSWDFGDGANSTDENPVHTFPEGGVEYTVTLTAIDGTDEDGFTQKVMTNKKIEPVILDWDHNVDTDGWNTVGCGFANSSDSYDLDDSNGKSTKMDGDGDGGAGDFIYQVVSVSTDALYNLSFWVYQKSTAGDETGAIVGTIETVVDGGATRGTVLSTVTTTTTTTKIWNKFESGDFDTGANSSVVIRLTYVTAQAPAGQTEGRVDYVEME